MYTVQFTRTARVLEALNLADFRQRPEETPRDKASYRASVLGSLDGHLQTPNASAGPFAGERRGGEALCVVSSILRTHLDFGDSKETRFLLKMGVCCNGWATVLTCPLFSTTGYRQNPNGLRWFR